MRKKPEIYLVHLSGGRVEISPSAENKDNPITTIILPKGWTLPIKEGGQRKFLFNFKVTTAAGKTFIVPIRFIFFFTGPILANNLVTALKIQTPSEMNQTVDLGEFMTKTFASLNYTSESLARVAQTVTALKTGKIQSALYRIKMMANVMFTNHFLSNIKSIDVKVEKPVPEKYYVMKEKVKKILISFWNREK